MNARDFLPRAYKHATRDAYSHLLLDMRSDTDERLRVRAKVFDEYPVVSGGEDSINTSAITKFISIVATLL